MMTETNNTVRALFPEINYISSLQQTVLQPSEMEAAYRDMFRHPL